MKTALLPLALAGLIRGHVYHLTGKSLKSASGQPLWHPDAYYILNEVPK